MWFFNYGPTIIIACCLSGLIGYLLKHHATHGHVKLGSYARVQMNEMDEEGALEEIETMEIVSVIRREDGSMLIDTTLDEDVVNSLLVQALLFQAGTGALYEAIEWGDGDEDDE